MAEAIEKVKGAGKIERIAVEMLLPYAKNSRTHSDEQVAQIAASIKEFGFNNPILIDKENTVIAGHGRLLAARRLNIKQVPCIQLSHLSENQRRAYIIADNKLALNAGWDNELLALEIEDLENLGFNTDLLGFDPSELNTADVDYSVLDGEDVKDQLNDMASGVRKAIQIEFEPEHYDEAFELVKFWRDQKGYVGMMLVNHLKNEKAKL
jgi:ParB-like chromosome segregation protein Spo0J